MTKSLLRSVWNRFTKPSPQKVFSGLSDEEWLAILEASTKRRKQRGILLPGFPDRELQVATVGNANLRTINEAFCFYSLVRNTCASLGTSIGRHTRILDFGVGWGRIVRCFLRDTPYLYGVDVNETYLAAATSTGCPAKLSKIDPLGALPYPDREFDLVYAYSIFTHLPEPVQDHWLLEIARTLKPGGMFFATVQPPRFLDSIRATDVNNEKAHPWMRGLSAKLAADPSIADRLRDEGSVYIPTTEVYGDRIMTEDYLRQRWSRWFKVLDFLDDQSRFKQAVATSCKPLA